MIKTEHFLINFHYHEYSMSTWVPIGVSGSAGKLDGVIAELKSFHIQRSILFMGSEWFEFCERPLTSSVEKQGEAPVTTKVKQSRTDDVFKFVVT